MSSVTTLPPAAEPARVLAAAADEIETLRRRVVDLERERDEWKQLFLSRAARDFHLFTAADLDSTVLAEPYIEDLLRRAGATAP